MSPISKMACTFVVTLVASASLPARAASFSPSEQVTPEVDLARYEGIWYEIAHYSGPKDWLGSRNAFVRYYLDPSDPTRLHAVSEKDRFGGMSHRRTWGTLTMPDPQRKSELLLTYKWFGRTQTVPYHVLALADDYSWAMIGEPTHQSLWIVARAPYLPTDLLQDLVRTAAGAFGYVDAPNRLRCTTQAGNVHAACKEALQQN